MGWQVTPPEEEVSVACLLVKCLPCSHFVEIKPLIIHSFWHEASCVLNMERIKNNKLHHNPLVLPACQIKLRSKDPYDAFLVALVEIVMLFLMFHIINKNEENEFRIATLI